MKIAMLNGRVLLKLQAAPDKIGSLYIPDTGKDAPQIAIVHAVHAGFYDAKNDKTLPPLVHEGDKVLFPKYAGSEIELDGEKYISIDEDDLHAIVLEEDAQPEPSQP